MCLEINLQLIEAIIQPCIACTGSNQRARSAPTKIKTLYHIYQLHKNIAKGKWTQIFQGKTAIVKGALVGKKHFSEFINSEDFKIFGEVEHRAGTTNIYRLHGWVIECFSFFEKHGMMKNFRSKFSHWKETFLKRLHKWLIPLARKGIGLSMVMNNLSTKKPLKGDGSNGLKGVGINPSVVPPMNSPLERSRETRVPPVRESLKELDTLAENMSKNFSIREGDIHRIINQFSLAEIRGGLKIRRSMKSFNPISQIAILWTCLKKYRTEKHSGRRNAI